VNLVDPHRRPFSIRIFLAEGTPSGLKFVEKSNWTGVGVVCPRPRFTSVKDRKEFARAGVYVLVGPSDSSDRPLVYVGEGDPVRTRLEDHHSRKDFWTVSYFFTSKDSNLNKAHIEYLEHRLIVLAKDAKRSQLDNANLPTAPSLSEAEQSDVESFLDEMLLCFPVLGVTIFERPEIIPTKRIQLFLKSKGVVAEGYESEDGFVVKEGATAVATTVPSIPGFAASLRDDLMKSGVLVKRTDDFLELTQNYEFLSPSGAAAFLIGSSVNGRDAWKTHNGQTLKHLQETANDS
jgi:hypothetical protein